MPVDVIIPATFGDSISEVTLGEWLKREGEAVAAEEQLIEVESEKLTQPLVAQTAGVLTKILKQAGETVPIGAVVAIIDPAGVPAAAPAPAPAPAAPVAPPAAPAAARVMPAAQRVLAENGVNPASVTPTGPGGRILKEDVQRQVAPAVVAPPPAPKPAPTSTTVITRAPAAVIATQGDRSEKRTPMSSIRKRIAQRLLEAQHNAALLTTFNECDMSAVMALRKQHQDSFTERHGVKLGFMSFFVKAAVDGLMACPQLNSEIQGSEIVSHNYVDVGVAIGGGKGLVVPVLRSAERMTFAEIELAIADFAKRAQSGDLQPHELQGGTFTITNGGVYGSLMSTPIVNPPQSGVLGMHATQDRPVVRDGQIVIRPMMYLALTYDHRIVDGREAVTFLKRIKECIENPVRLMLEV